MLFQIFKFLFFNCECLKLRNLKLRRSDIVCIISQCYVCLLCQHRIINMQDKFCFVTTLRCKCRIICSMHCEYNQPHTPIEAQGLYQIINHPYTQTPLHVTWINRHNQGSIMPGHVKQKHQIHTNNYKNKIKITFSIVYVNLVCWFHIFPCIKSSSVWRYIAVTCRRVYMYR